jgi:hypothetical protein
MKRTGKEVNCAACGKPKYVPLCRLKKFDRFFCDTTCQMIWRKEKQSGENWPTYKRTVVKCEYCGEEKLVKDYEIEASINGRFYCNQNCMINWRIESGIHAKENNVNWRGGEHEIWYDDYCEKLCQFEEIRRNPENENLLQIKCTYCNKFHNPERHQIFSRIAWFEGRSKNEGRFYCSESCKNNCPIFGQVLYPRDHGIATSREVQSELRKMCFERDNWTCQICSLTENLHCHHYEGIQYNPIESADLDMVITLCYDCHHKVHSVIGCRMIDLRCMKNLGLPHAALNK